jgi:hypothetical protein
MSTLILAIENPLLLTVCHQALMRGHVSIILHSPQALVSLPQTVTCDLVCIDGSELGQAVIEAIRTQEFPPLPIIGIGIQGEGLAASVALPLNEDVFIRVVQGVLRVASRPDIELNAGARAASCHGEQVTLTPIEFRLLETLYARQPAEVQVNDLVWEVWGFPESRSNSLMVRAHVRNLRRKLAQIGLADAVRSRRGLGYALVLQR